MRPFFSFASASRIRRVRHDLRRREVVVSHVERIGPRFVAVTFSGESLRDFASDSFDDHVKFMVDAPGGEPVRRDYTPRRFDRARGELVIEFALHGHGQASAWAARAQPGMPASVGGPRGSMIIPTDYAWHLLAGDATALPAIARRLEELPAGVPVSVLLQLPDPADRRDFGAREGLTVQYVDGSEAMLQALRAEPLPAGEGFVWAAGEATEMARWRDVLIREKGHPRGAARVAAYWRRGASGYHDNLEG